MSNTVEELVVAARPDGISETEGELEGLEDSLDDSAESMNDTADGMGNIQSRWQGAMSALVTGLMVASAGLLSQVPVIGEMFGGLGAVVGAVAFQMDQVLRPILQPITDGFFRLSGAIFEADGAMGTAIGVIASIIAVLGVLAGIIATVGGLFGGLAGAKLALIAAGKLVIAAIGALVGALSLPVIAVGVLIAALALLVWYFRDEITSAIGTVGDWLTDLGGWFRDMASNVGDIFGDMISDALSWGKNLIGEFISGIESRASDLGDTVEDAMGEARDKLPFSPAKEGPLSDLDESGPGFVETFASGIEANVGRVGQAASGAAGAASPSDPTGFRASRGGGGDIYLKGKKMNKENSKELFGQTASRNRNG